MTPSCLCDGEFAFASRMIIIHKFQCWMTFHTHIHLGSENMVSEPGGRSISPGTIKIGPNYIIPSPDPLGTNKMVDAC